MTNFAKDTNVPIIPGHDNCHDIAEMSYNNGYAKGCEDSKPRWIPVTERFPKEDGKYLVHKDICGTPYITVVWFAKDARKVDRYDFRRNWKNVWYLYDDEVGYYATSTVTHWMPLPEPPEGVR